MTRYLNKCLILCLAALLLCGCLKEENEKNVRNGLFYKGAKLTQELFGTDHYQYNLRVTEPGEINCALYVVKDGVLEKVKEIQAEISSAPARGYLALGIRKESTGYSYDYKLVFATETMRTVVEAGNRPVLLDIPKGYSAFLKEYDSSKKYNFLNSGEGSSLFSQVFKKLTVKGTITTPAFFHGSFEDDFKMEGYEDKIGIFLAISFNRKTAS
jgi:hypothetical protein